MEVQTSDTTHTAIPAWMKTFFHLIFVSIVNPFVIGINILLIWTNLARETSTNVSKLFGWAIPAWILSALILALVFVVVQSLIVRIAARISYADFRRIDIFAQLPYVPFFFFYQLFMLSELEGNIIGFIVFPGFIILALVTIPISFFISLILIIFNWGKLRKETH